MLAIPTFLNRPRQTLKELRHRVRTALIQRFFSFTPHDLVGMLRGLGIETGDVVCVHSDFDAFCGFRGSAGDAVRALQEAVGPAGGLMMPTQPFVGRAVDYVRQDVVTDLVRTPSRVGLLTEILRRSKGVARSTHPTHPVAVWGARGHALLGEDWKAGTPCGKGTAYHRLLEERGKILMLGAPWVVTFYHCVEEEIESLMPFSPFTEEVFVARCRDAAGTVHTSHLRLFDPRYGRHRRTSLMAGDLAALGYPRRGRVGRLQVMMMPATAVLEACRAMALRGEYCYMNVPHPGNP